jgi:hypothetical protein
MTVQSTELPQPGYRLTKSETKPLTPELAKHFRDLPPSPTERELNPRRINHLREKANAGQLITFAWSVAKLDDKLVRMNGQHSSNMLCELNGQFPKGLKVHYDEYEVDGPEALATLFRQFDDRKSGRTPSDVSGAYQGLYEQLKPVPRDTAKLAVEGVTWYRREILGSPAPSGDDRYTLFAEEGLREFILWLGELFTIKTPELRKQTIVAAIYGTFTANEKEARKFWTEVARGGVEFDDDATQTVLDSWLKSAAERKGANELKPANYYQGCVFAWNAHREGKTIPAIRYDAKKGWNKIHE